MGLKVTSKEVITSTRIIPEAPISGTGTFFPGGGYVDFNFSGCITGVSILTTQIAARGSGFGSGIQPVNLVLGIYQVPGGKTQGIANRLGTATILLPALAAVANVLGTFGNTIYIVPGTYFLAFGFIDASIVGGELAIIDFFNINMFAQNAYVGTHPMTFTSGLTAAPPATVDVSAQVQNGNRFAPSAWLL